MLTKSTVSGFLPLVLDIASIFNTTYILTRNSIIPTHKAFFPSRPPHSCHPLRIGSFQILTALFKFSEHREVDKRIFTWRDLLQPGIHDQRAHISGGQTEGISTCVRKVETAGTMEVGKRHDAWETGQCNDSEVDATTWHFV